MPTQVNPRRVITVDDSGMVTGASTTPRRAPPPPPPRTVVTPRPSPQRVIPIDDEGRTVYVPNYAARGNAVAVTTSLVAAAFPDSGAGAARSKYEMAAFESETHRTFRDVGADDKYLFAGQRAVWEDADGTSARGKTKKLGGERIAKFVAQDGICTVTDPVTGISYPIECPDTFPGLQELPGFRQDEGDSEIAGAVDIEALKRACFRGRRSACDLLLYYCRQESNDDACLAFWDTRAIPYLREECRAGDDKACEILRDMCDAGIIIVGDRNTDCRARSRCSEARENELNLIKNILCGNNILFPRACDSGLPCFEINRRIANNLACLAARQAIDDECYQGMPDSGHETQENQIINSIYNCYTNYTTNGCHSGSIRR